ncbi:hypothetical protein ACBJ59_42295 [Nonomuraea sp. MTCD27]|uniref:hypothetical protein n=1 Tax=Nonomuraea sp. MTCD27 TaxID=1676747 RepID=UPI0035BFBE60
MADQVRDLAAKRGDAGAGLVDLRNIDLPVPDEVMPAPRARYGLPHIRSVAGQTPPASSTFELPVEE